MVIRVPPESPSGRSSVHTIDFRETAPAMSNSTMFSKSPLLSKFGGLSVAVPGEIRGLHVAHSKFGRLPWARLFEPSIQLANNGWKVTAELDRRLKLFGQGWMEQDPDWSPTFAPEGKLLKQGDWIRRENFSYTLTSIANEGPDAFYTVSICSRRFLGKILIISFNSGHNCFISCLQNPGHWRNYDCGGSCVLSSCTTTGPGGHLQGTSCLHDPRSI
jgi:hypothetical protein